MKNILITQDSKKKIRVVELSYYWNESLSSFIIDRQSYQLNGAITKHPLIEIKKGKASRTILEQVILEYNSHLKKYLDKGYKNINDFGINSLSKLNENHLKNFTVSDTNGAKKPMLAKKASDVNISVFNNKYYASRKLDGVRCELKAKNNILYTASRGGGNYDAAAYYIMQDNILHNYLASNTNIVLDGELYIHGKPLQYISGISRKITTEDAHKELKLYVYDLKIDNVIFSERLKMLNDVKQQLKNCDKVVFVEHVETNSWSDVKSLHDKWVEEGYEGCVIRDPNKEYGYGKKDNRMIKVKEFQDDEFEITGITDGLRDEDFVFNLITKDGKAFEAKPIGTRELRQEYRNNINNIIGKYGTVKYFGFTPDGIPNLPIFKSVRTNDE